MKLYINTILTRTIKRKLKTAPVVAILAQYVLLKPIIICWGTRYMGNPGKGLFWSSLTDMSMGTAYLVEPVDSYYPLKKLRSGYAVAIFNRRICQFDLKVKKGVETVQNLIGL